MPEGVNTRKCFRARTRGIVYTLKKDLRTLALHLLHPLLRVFPAEAARLSPRRVSGLRHQRLCQRGRTPAWTTLDLPVKSFSTVRESARLRPSPRLLWSDSTAGMRTGRDQVLPRGLGGQNLSRRHRVRPRPQSRGRYISVLGVKTP